MVDGKFHQAGNVFVRKRIFRLFRSCPSQPDALRAVDLVAYREISDDIPTRSASEGKIEIPRSRFGLIIQQPASDACAKPAAIVPSTTPRHNAWKRCTS